MDKKTTEEFMNMLELNKILDMLAKTNGLRWYEHVLRRDDDDVLKKSLVGQREDD